MSKKKNRNRTKLYDLFPPSKPCSCDICHSYCQRPGWWTVKEAENVIRSGLANRMMLEISPEFNFSVLSPAFKGNEGNIALQIYSKQGCTFLLKGLCELFDTNLRPLECCFCHHQRTGQGIICHNAIEKDWKTESGLKLVNKWIKIIGLSYLYNFQFNRKI